MTPTDPDPPFTLAARARSFSHAFRGIATLLASQHNARIHALATIAVVIVGFALGVTRLEWALLVAAIALVWLAEAFNTAVEFVADVGCGLNGYIDSARAVRDSFVLHRAEYEKAKSLSRPQLYVGREYPP